MFCVPRRVISTNDNSVWELRRTYTSMRLERFEESADMVVVARNNDLRALFGGGHAQTSGARCGSAHPCFAADVHLAVSPLTSTMSQAIGNVSNFDGGAFDSA